VFPEHQDQSQQALISTTISYICTYAKPHLSFPLQSGLTTFRMYYQDLCWVECCHTTTFWPSNIIPPGFNFSRPFFRGIFSCRFLWKLCGKWFSAGNNWTKNRRPRGYHNDYICTWDSTYVGTYICDIGLYVYIFPFIARVVHKGILGPEI
jgi:hypothetical protein